MTQILDDLKEALEVIQSLPPMPERIEMTHACFGWLLWYLTQRDHEETIRRWMGDLPDPPPTLGAPLTGVPVVIVDDVPAPGWRIIWPNDR